jgi:hypothetical protein
MRTMSFLELGGCVFLLLSSRLLALSVMTLHELTHPQFNTPRQKTSQIAVHIGTMKETFAEEEPGYASKSHSRSSMEGDKSLPV